jgi:predicted nucleic acid-binding protein
LREPPPVHTLRCTDVDDQKFIDLAIATSARWLVTRDRALLKRARRAAPLGLSIATPVQWRAPADTP